MPEDSLILPSCPKGLFGAVVVDKDYLSPGAVFSNRNLNSNEGTLLVESEDGHALLGAVYGERGEHSIVKSNSSDKARIGITLGMFFGESILSNSPHRASDHASSILPHCNGMFSTAAYADGKLYLISDPFGTYPIYYTYNEHGIVFSSSLQEVLNSKLVVKKEHNRSAVAQFLCLGKLVTAESVWKEVYKTEGATKYEYDRESKQSKQHRYWSPEFDRDKSAATVGLATDALKDSVHSSVHAATGNTVAAITGGLDSRVIWSVLKAEKLLNTAVTHYMEDGHDSRIAASLAKTLGVEHQVVHINDKYSDKFEDHLQSFLTSTNGMIPADNAHLSFLYMHHASYTDSIIDGINTNIERKTGLREHVQEFDSVDTATTSIAAAMLSKGTYNLLADDVQKELYQECLEAIYIQYNKTAANITAKERSDAFYLQFVVPHYATDTVLLQNHYNLFISPYYNLDYIQAIARVHHKLRSRYVLQRSILHSTIPGLWRTPRAYGEIKTLPCSNPQLQILPLAWDRLVAPKLARLFPGQYKTSCYLRKVSMNYSEIFRNYLLANIELMKNNLAPYISEEKFDRFIIDYLNNQHHDDETVARLIAICSPHSVFQASVL